MPYKCVVPNCKGNYKNGPKVSVYRFPSNAELLQKWKSAIPRDLMISKHSRVCELHFQTDDIEEEANGFDEKNGTTTSVPLSQKRLRRDAVPRIFPDCPGYLSSKKPTRDPPDTKKAAIEKIQITKALNASIAAQKEYERTHNFSNFEELLTVLECQQLPKNWNKFTDEKVILFKMNYDDVPHIICSVTIDNFLMLKVFFKGTELTKLLNYKLPFKVIDICSLLYVVKCIDNLSLDAEQDESVLIDICCDVLRNISNVVNEDKKCMLSFIIQQITLLNSQKNHYRYDSNYLILCSLTFSISPHAYRFLRNSNFFIMPHPSTLHSLCSKFSLNPKSEEQPENFLMYAKMKFRNLLESDTTVVILMDEVHIKPFIDYKGGSIIGMSYDGQNAATSAHVFMVQSIKSSYRDVVYILPAKCIDGKLLNKIVSDIVVGLEKIGYKVVGVCSDNNAINRNAMSLFATPPTLSIVYNHPAQSDRPLFYFVDAVHIFKCIRNNWINQKNYGQCMYYPKFPIEEPTLFVDVPVVNEKTKKVTNKKQLDKTLVKIASFYALKKLHGIESSEIIKYAPSLTSKALSPNSFERQDVQLAVNVFNDPLAEGLMLAGEKHNILDSASTAEYVKIISKWFSIMNVYTKYKGHHKRNVFQAPLSNVATDPKNIFLNQFLDWLDVWGKAGINTGHLTRETLSALKQTTHAMLEFVKYCVGVLKFEYVLTGKLQTDALERRFGKYRQLSGSNYNISLTQVYETEAKLRLQNVLPLYINSQMYGIVEISSIDDFSPDIDVNYENVPFSKEISVTSKDVINVENHMPVLTYISGYCCHVAIKKLNCKYCKSLLVTDDVLEYDSTFTLIKNLDRGGLKFPNIEVVNMVTYSYIVIEKILGNFENIFIKLPCQRKAASFVVHSVLSAQEKLLSFDECENSHSADFVSNVIISSIVNILLNNYSKKINNIAILKKKSMKKNGDNDSKFPKNDENPKKSSQKIKLDEQNDNECKRSKKMRKLQTLM